MKVHSYSALVALIGFGLLGFHSGCKKGSQGVNIKGSVSYKNKPVTGGRISFHPKSGGVPYTAEIMYDGAFVGIDVPPLGEVTVTVDNSHLKFTPPEGADTKGPIINPVDKEGDKVKMPVDPNVNVKIDTSKATKYVEIPAKYAKKDQSDLTWEIKAGENPPKTFELK